MTALIFTCRRCSTVFVGSYVGTREPEAALVHRVKGGDLLAVHDCGNGGAGLADLMGAIPEPEEKK